MFGNDWESSWKCIILPRPCTISITPKKIRRQRMRMEIPLSLQYWGNKKSYNIAIRFISSGNAISNIQPNPKPVWNTIGKSIVCKHFKESAIHVSETLEESRSSGNAATCAYENTPSSLDDRVSYKKVAATYSPTWWGSTIGDGELNFSVRNGKRWILTAITTTVCF